MLLQYITSNIYSPIYINLHIEVTVTILSVPLAAVFEIHSLSFFCTGLPKWYLYTLISKRTKVSGPKRHGAHWHTMQQFPKVRWEALIMPDSLGMTQGCKLHLCCLLPIRRVLTGTVQEGLFLISWHLAIPDFMLSKQFIWKKAQLPTFSNTPYVMGLPCGWFNLSL